MYINFTVIVSVLSVLTIKESRRKLIHVNGEIIEHNSKRLHSNRNKSEKPLNVIGHLEILKGKTHQQQRMMSRLHPNHPSHPIPVFSQMGLF